MPVHLTCPVCRATYTLPGTVDCKNVACKQCHQVFVAGTVPLLQERPPPSVWPTVAKPGVRNEGRLEPDGLTVAEPSTVVSLNQAPRADRSLPKVKKKRTYLVLWIVAGTLALSGVGSLGTALVMRLRLQSAATAEADQLVGVRPPTLEADKITRTLPSAIDDLCVGGGGRYLILHLPAENKLAIFDVNQADLVHSIPLADRDVKFAAGLDRLMVVLPGRKVIERWNLRTFKREHAVPIDIKGKLVAVSMGSASQGPLAVGVSEAEPDGPRIVGISFLDIKTMKLLPGPEISQSRSGFVSDMQMSADGTVLGVPGRDEARAIVRVNGSFTVHSGRPLRQITHITPSADGRVLVTNEGLYSLEMKPIGNNRQFNYDGPMVPAHQGHYYLKFDHDNSDRKGRREATRKISIVVYAIGDDSPILQLPELEGLESSNPLKVPGPELPLAKRIHFIPDARLIVTIPATQDRLILHRFDVETALEKADIDYLFVASQPNSQAKSGATYSCQLAVRSSKGGARYHLETAPEGMAVAAEGRLTWNVPAAFGERRTRVVTRINDAGGQERLYTFTIDISN